MISVARKALPRRRPNRVQLVEPNGSPARPSAESWPAWTDNHYWECGESAHALADHVTLPDVPEPDDDDRRDGAALWAEMMIEASLPPVTMPGIEPEPESDAQFFTRLAADEQAEKVRIEATYDPSPTDLAEYAAWAEALDAGTLPPSAAGRFHFGILDEIDPRQVSSDELGQLASHGCI